MNYKLIEKILTDDGSKEARFALASITVSERHGGRPTMSLTDDGQIQFTYPDGTVTVGGRRVN